jgi:hypothetical protein
MATGIRAIAAAPTNIFVKYLKVNITYLLSNVSNFIQKLSHHRQHQKVLKSVSLSNVCRKGREIQTKNSVFL